MDQIYDQVHFNFGDSRKRHNVMDLSSVATHELGHGYGLDDQYSAGCSHVTMGGSSREGSTGKRSLEQEDIAGIRKLYGGV